MKKPKEEIFHLLSVILQETIVKWIPKKRVPPKKDIGMIYGETSILFSKIIGIKIPFNMKAKIEGKTVKNNIIIFALK